MKKKVKTFANIAESRVNIEKNNLKYFLEIVKATYKKPLLPKKTRKNQIYKVNYIIGLSRQLF